jgi:hypothetical protein
MLFSSCILVTLKFAAGQQVCGPFHAKLGLKDWAYVCSLCSWNDWGFAMGLMRTNSTGERNWAKRLRLVENG